MSTKKTRLFAYRYKQNQLTILDQTRLPNKATYLQLKTYQQIIAAIKELKIRGAPLIGVAGAYGLALASLKKPLNYRSYLRKVANEIKSARPTAVNLSWAIDRLLPIINNPKISGNELSGALISEAIKIERTEQDNSYRIGKIGAQLIKDNMTILTICNTGWLAVPGIGTALGIIYTAHRQGKNLKVYVLETRPLLQGARLTAFELAQAKIPYTLITDSMIGSVMSKVNVVLVGADRIARNGDTANKIGTLTLAITAHYYQVPFYVVAPFSSFDLSIKSGKEIIIEERDKKEILYFQNHLIAPKQTNIYNPAFDITSSKLITGIITEKGIIYPPYIKNIRKWF